MGFLASPVQEAFFYFKEYEMERRIALIGIIVENPESVENINQILHENAGYIIGRMGLPYRQHNLSIISVVLDAPQDVISKISGRLGMLPGINVKTIHSKILTD